MIVDSLVVVFCFHSSRNEGTKTRKAVTCVKHGANCAKLQIEIENN